ncbi:MAG: amidohydrolase [Comamonadaceae bacterium]|nr:MAG: amidohydrolase [Comamonadaceae bacterium]
MTLASFLIGSAALLVTAFASAQPAPAVALPDRIAKIKAEAVRSVDSRQKLAQVINDTLFSYAELAFQEVESSRYLTGLLEQNGFTVQRGVAGMPTAWVARWGSGKPVIALGSDIDGLPRASQKPGVAYREALVEDAPGHGEGHNSGQAVNIVAALAVKALMEREKMPGTLVLWPGVAEELLAGKPFMVRDGVFEGVDVVLYNHVSNNLRTTWGQADGTGMVSVEYTFKGRSAHSALLPWRGRSALDAVELMNVGWNFRREHLRPEQRSHYVITNGGDQPNVVPDTASVWYFLRELDFENIVENAAINHRIAEAAASMTDTTVHRTIIGAAAPRHFNKPIAEAMQSNIDKVGLPQWTPDEQIFAKAVQTLVSSKPDGLNLKPAALLAPSSPARSGGSDDIGDVSWVVPTVTLYYPANIPNVPSHHWASAIAMATPIAHKGVIAGAKVTAMTAVDILTRPELLVEAAGYFNNVQLKTGKYVPLIGKSDKPQIQMNLQTMERFRPQMRPYYYDSAKYETYLDQLGVKFPTLIKP